MIRLSGRVFVWPKGELKLQIYIVICLLLLALARGINLLVPMYYKRVVDKLTPNPNGDSLEFPVDDIVVYVCLRFLQGGGTGSMGLLSNLRSFLWYDPISFLLLSFSFLFFLFAPLCFFTLAPFFTFPLVAPCFGLFVVSYYS